MLTNKNMTRYSKKKKEAGEEMIVQSYNVTYNVGDKRNNNKWLKL